VYLPTKFLLPHCVEGMLLGVVYIMFTARS